MEGRERHRHRRGCGCEGAGEGAGEGDGICPRSTTRVQLELPPQAMERLQRLKERTEAASYAEVVRQSLRLFEALAGEHDKGAELLLKRADGEAVSFKIFL
jgi:hypothetical protein